MNFSNSILALGCRVASPPGGWGKSFCSRSRRSLRSLGRAASGASLTLNVASNTKNSNRLLYEARPIATLAQRGFPAISTLPRRPGVPSGNHSTTSCTHCRTSCCSCWMSCKRSRTSSSDCRTSGDHSWTSGNHGRMSGCHRRASASRCRMSGCLRRMSGKNLRMSCKMCTTSCSDCRTWGSGRPASVSHRNPSPIKRLVARGAASQPLLRRTTLPPVPVALPVGSKASLDIIASQGTQYEAMPEDLSQFILHLRSDTDA